MTKERISSRILIPLALALLVLLVASLLSTHWLQRRRIDDEVHADIKQLQRLFQLEIDKGGQLLSGLIDFIEKDEQLQKAWLRRDRKTLLEYSQPILENLRNKYRVTHFYFLGLDRICFLRVHKPSREGDYINRFTLDGAIQDKRAVYGIELGPLGTFTLRSVHPWLIDGKLAGFIELGIDVEGLALHLKEILGGELLVAIEKSYLQRSDWEQGMEMLGRESRWDEFADFVVVEATTGTVPPALAANMQQHQEEGHKKFLFGTSLAGRSYRSGFVPLLDFGGREVGELIYMDDVSQAEVAMLRAMEVTAGVYLVTGGILLGFFYLLLKHLEETLASARNNLELSNKQLEQETAELKQARSGLSEEIEQRSVIEAQLQRHIFELKQAKQATLTMMKDAQSAKRFAEQSERALRANEQRYRALFERSPDGILIANIQTRKFKYANSVICTMLGYSESELKKLTVKDIHPQDALDYIGAEYDAQARGQKRFAQTIPCLRKDGSRMYADIYTVKMLVDGQMCEIGFFRDVCLRGAPAQEQT